MGKGDTQTNIKILKPPFAYGETAASSKNTSCSESDESLSSFDSFVYKNKQLSARYERYMEAVNMLTCLLRWEEALRRGESVHIPSFVTNYEVGGRSVPLRLKLDGLSPDVMLALIGQLTSSVAEEVTHHCEALLGVCTSLKEFYDEMRNSTKGTENEGAGDQSG